MSVAHRVKSVTLGSTGSYERTPSDPTSQQRDASSRESLLDVTKDFAVVVSGAMLLKMRHCVFVSLIFV